MVKKSQSFDSEEPTLPFFGRSAGNPAGNVRLSKKKAVVFAVVALITLAVVCSVAVVQSGQNRAKPTTDAGISPTSAPAAVADASSEVPIDDNRTPMSSPETTSAREVANQTDGSSAASPLDEPKPTPSPETKPISAPEAISDPPADSNEVGQAPTSTPSITTDYANDALVDSFSPSLVEGGADKTVSANTAEQEGGNQEDTNQLVEIDANQTMSVQNETYNDSLPMENGTALDETFNDTMFAEIDESSGEEGDIVWEEHENEENLASQGTNVSDSQASIPHIDTPDNSGGFHYPLPCNANVRKNISSCQTELSSFLLSGENVIPCGECVYVDYALGETVTLPSGLRIEGMLYFPHTANVVIRTTHLFVLGILYIPFHPVQVKFSLFGNEDVIFHPHEFNNKATCNETEGCNFGSKAIAVVGGELDIHGYSCRAWEKLQNVAVVGTPLSEPCGARELLLDGDFESSREDLWQGYDNTIQRLSPGYGSFGSTMMVSDRDHWSKGVFQELDTSCLAKGQEWHVTAKVQLLNQSTGEVFSCNPDVPFDCPMIRIYYHKDGYDSIYEYPNSHQTWFEGTWNDLDVDFMIEEDYPDRMQFIVCGGHAGTVLLVDDVTLAPKGYPDTVDQILVSKEAAACWSPGTELVLTSHTHHDKDRQLVSVKESDSSTGIITLSRPILRPMTTERNGDFGVEVGSLTRPVVFEAEDDNTDNLTGGHLIVYYTPARQHVEGVELRNMGQQGTLGKYPFHMHFCDDHSGSVVRKNVVRDSNQRCYVLHQTNRVLLEDNIALDAFGHCYFLEDGVEVLNMFRHNLGLGIKKATRLLSEQSGRVETDDQPSVFWMSNPSNHFIGNVAAGGEQTGYWIETPMERQHLDLGVFKDNEAHSMQSFGFTTYPPGWTPRQPAVIENIKIYRNVGSGLFLHVTRDLTLLGGVVADNGEAGVYILQADNIRLLNTKIIGRSSKDVDVPLICRIGLSSSGILLHPTKLQEFDYSGKIAGTTLTNVEFINWSEDDTGCSNVSPVNFTHSLVKTPSFDAPHQFINVTFEEGASTVQACVAESLFGVDDIILEVVTDPSGSFSPFALPGFLVSPKLTPFIPTGCSTYNECLDFCVGACLRTVRFLVNSAISPDVTMVVSDGVGTVVVTRKLREDNSLFPFYDGVFNVAVPAGNYFVRFEDRFGNLIYPGYAVPIFEAAPACPDYVRPGDIQLIVPDQNVCSDIAMNGGFDSGIDGWQEIFAGIKWNPTGGVASSGGLETTSRSGSTTSISQWLDSNCINDGYVFQISLSFKFLGVNVTACDEDFLCPDIGIVSSKLDLVSGEFSQKFARYVGVITFDGAFGHLLARWEVTEDQAQADKVRFAFNVYQDNVQYVVDNVHIVKEGDDNVLR